MTDPWAVDEYNARVAADMSENVLQSRVEGAARQLGWLFYHTHDSRRSHPGFPDLALAKDQRLIFAELKSQKGRLRPEQKLWLDALGQIPGVDVFLWRPADWLDGTITSVLSPDGDS